MSLGTLVAERSATTTASPTLEARIVAVHDGRTTPLGFGTDAIHESPHDARPSKAPAPVPDRRLRDTDGVLGAATVR